LDPKKALQSITESDENEKRAKLIDTMAYHVNESYLRYKESGSVEKTLVRLKLIKNRQDEQKYNV